MPLSTNATLSLAQDSGIVYRQVSSGTAVDNVFVFSDGTNKYKYENGAGQYIARAGGILPGTDKTAALQAIFNHSSVNEVVIDSGDITISGTLTIPANKKLTFQGTGRLIGSGTVNGGIITASYHQNIFATTLTINPQGVSDGKFSAKWFGAVGDGVTNDQPAIQKAINTCIANQSKFSTVFIPSGNYVCSTSLLMENFSSGSYQFHTVFLEGETSWWGAGGQGTSLFFPSKLLFGIGVQLGKGTKISKIKLTGNFVPPATSGYAWFSIDFQNFVTDGSLDTNYAVNAGIVIDPFSRTGSVPTNHYVGYESNYTKDATNSNGGSTGVIIEDVMIFNFVAGIVCSINGQTRNAEQCRYEKIQLGNMKAGFINCTDQEKMNVIDHVGAWSAVHTLFIGGHTYGASTPGVYNVSNVNIAGAVNRLFEVYEGGYFSSHFDRIFSESMGSLGIYSSNMHPTISNSELGLEYPATQGAYPNTVISGGGLTFKNCSIRYYGSFIPIVIDGSFNFINCRFEEVPFFGTYANFYNRSLCNFVDCKTSTGPFGFQSGTRFCQQNDQMIAFGKYTIQDPTASDGGRDEIYEMTESLPYAVLRPTGTYTINPSGTRDATITVGSTNIKYFYVNKLVFTYAVSGNVILLGQVTNVNTGTNQITISYIPKQITNGSYSLLCPFLKYSVDFVGDIQIGSTIANCEFSGWSSNAAGLVGKVIPLTTNQDNFYVPWTLVTGAPDASTLQVTAVFGNNIPNTTFKTGKKTIKMKAGQFYTYPSLVTKGTIVEEPADYRTGVSGAKLKAEATTDGYGVNVFLGKSRKSYFRNIDQINKSVIKVSANLTVSPAYDIYEVDTTSGNIDITMRQAAYMTMFLNGYSRVIRIIKTSSDNNKVNVNQNVINVTEPISGLSQIVLEKQHEWVDIEFSTIDVDPSVNPNYWTVRVVGRSDLNKVDTLTVSADTSKAYIADSLITHILVKPASDLTAFRVGTTPGGDELVTDTIVPGGSYTAIDVPYYFESAGTLYFTGIGAVSTTIKIYKKLSN